STSPAISSVERTVTSLRRPPRTTPNRKCISATGGAVAHEHVAALLGLPVMHRARALMAAAALLAAAPAAAETTPSIAAQFIGRSWGTADGLPQNSVTAIVQARDGYLWLGTFGGLVRFDGHAFTVFDPGNTPG